MTTIKYTTHESTRVDKQHINKKQNEINQKLIKKTHKMASLAVRQKRTKTLTSPSAGRFPKMSKTLNETKKKANTKSNFLRTFFFGSFLNLNRKKKSKKQKQNAKNFFLAEKAIKIHEKKTFLNRKQTKNLNFFIG
jgi:hypothetical protein